MDAIQLSTDNVRRRGLVVPQGVGGRGIYELTFQDGRRYAGHTEDVIVRMGGHFRTYDDIAAISYRPMPSGDLISAFWHVRRADASGARGWSSRDLEPVPDSSLARIAWIETHVAVPGSERPPEVVGQRERTLRNFERLSAHPDFGRLMRLVNRYLDCVIPAPAATERRNWVITSMPSTASTRVWHRLLCLSVNNVEALTIGEQFDGERWTVAGFMSASAPRSSSPSILPLAARRRGAFLAPAHYLTVGDVAQIGFDSLDALGPLLDSDAVLDHVGELVMRLMRRGRGMYGRFHDYNLADAVLRKP